MRLVAFCKRYLNFKNKEKIHEIYKSDERKY